MKIYKTSLFFILLSFSHLALAGGGSEAGNGGDAVICYTSNARTTIQSVQFFDYWEQPQVHNFGKIDLGGTSTDYSVRAKIGYATSKISFYDPDLAREIRRIADNIAENIQSYLVTSYVLPEITDANPKVIPSQPNCFIEQFAIQHKDVQTGQRRFYISDLFYNHPSTTNDDRAGLILHEAIYRYAILLADAKNSDGVRFFNYVIASKKINDLPKDALEEYFKLLKLAGIYDGSCKQNEYGLYVKSDRTCYGQSFTVGKVKFLLRAYTQITPRPAEKSIEFSSYNPYNEVTLPNIDGKPASVTTDKFTLHSGDILEVIHSSSSSPTWDYPMMFGPMNQVYECRGFRVVAKTGEMQSCLIEKVQLPIYDFAKTPISDEWLVTKFDSYAELNVLGSKKNLPLGKDLVRARVNSQLQVLEGHRFEQAPLTPITLNGYDYNVSEFKVINYNGAYVLKFTAGGNYRNARVRGFRIIASDPNEAAAENFCKFMGLNKGHLGVIRSEYIGIKAEQFYDLSTNTIVYKTDEDVEVYPEIYCDEVSLETTDY